MNKKRTIIFEAALVAGVLATGIAAAQTAHASPLSIAVQATPDPRANIKIESNILVERTDSDAQGNVQTKLLKPSDVKVIPGDKLVFINSYTNTGAAAVTGFVVNNPIHPAVSFTDISEAWALVSVDDGKTYGRLSDLSVTVEASATVTETESGDVDKTALTLETRAAQPADVTHIRWAFPAPIASKASGKLQFRGFVK